MKTYFKKNNRGLTLIETILYITLFSGIMLLAMPLLANIFTGQFSSAKLSDAIDTAMFVQEKIRYYTKLSNEVTAPISGHTAQDFSFDTENLGDEHVFANYTNDLRILNDEAGLELPLTGSSTKIQNLDFYQPSRLSNEFQRLEFSADVNGYNFGTATYFFRDE